MTIFTRGFSAMFQIGAIIIRKKGKFEQPRTAPKAEQPVVPEFDLSWLDQPGEEAPVEQSPELPQQEPAAAADQSEAPTMLIPDLPQQAAVDADEAPTVFIPTVTPEPVPEVKKPAAPMKAPVPQAERKPAPQERKGGMTSFTRIFWHSFS